MRRIIASAFVSLDGVMQGPGGPDEDSSGGFAHSGWLPQFMEADNGDVVEKLFDGDFDLLLGRRTYDIFAAYWPFAVGPEVEIGGRFDRATKYVLSRSDMALDWQNSVHLPDMDAVAALKAGEGPDLIIQGSATLYPQLLARGLIDRLTLLIFPLTLGGGKRLFGDGTPARALRLISHHLTPGGTIVATYEAAGALVPGNFAVQSPSAPELKRRAAVAAGTW